MIRKVKIFTALTVIFSLLLNTTIPALAAANGFCIGGDCEKDWKDVMQTNKDGERPFFYPDDQTGKRVKQIPIDGGGGSSYCIAGVCVSNDLLPVNGGWSNWSGCKPGCGQRRYRERYCDNSPERNGGRLCPLKTDQDTNIEDVVTDGSGSFKQKRYGDCPVVSCGDRCPFFSGVAGGTAVGASAGALLTGGTLTSTGVAFGASSLAAQLAAAAAAAGVTIGTGGAALAIVAVVGITGAIIGYGYCSQSDYGGQ